MSGEGHVNLSPKGHDSLRILSTNRVAYLDLTGSGNETSAHKERDTLQRWSIQKGEAGLRQYWREKNVKSIDGLPAPLGDQWANS
ncbi:hypothetical protein COLU111180_14385 [Cohnella lubricantis]|nr:hypothetical protein [Cohnella lubricantis]